MSGCGDGPVCLLDADEVGLDTSGFGKSGLVVLFESKASVGTIPTDGVEILTLPFNARERVMEIVDVRVRAIAMTDVDIWFWKSSTATAEMTVVAENEDTIGKFENRVPKAVKVEVTVAKLSPELATAWTSGDPSRAITDPRTWKNANDFMICIEFLVQTCRKVVHRVEGEGKTMLAE